MTDVIAWPPVGLTAFEISRTDPVSVSTTLFQSRPFVSKFGRTRRVATNVVTGFGYDASGAGYMEMFKEFLEGGSNLIRLDITSGIWHFVRANSNPLLTNSALEWTTSGTDLYWTTSGTDLVWYEKAFYGTPFFSGGFAALQVTGLPPNTMVIRPHEIVSVMTPTGKELRRAVKPAISNSSGVANIRIPTSFSAPGPVILGDKESVVFRVDGQLPRAVQPQIGEWTYEWSLVEAFEDEYEEWTEVNPWN